MGKLTTASKGMNHAHGVIQKWLASSKNASASAASRIGLSSATPGAVLQAAKDNPVTTALVLMEAGSVGSSALEALLEEKPELRELVQTMGYSNDKVEKETHVLDLPKFKDEFECITNAARSLGGLDRLQILRRALAMDDSVYALYDQVRNIKRVF